MELLDKLNWRYAAKAMNGEEVSQEKMDNIIEAASLAPTSSGLQPFEIIDITNPEVKAKIKTIAWNQSVITDCSHLLVFAAWDTYTEDRINIITINIFFIILLNIFSRANIRRLRRA